MNAEAEQVIVDTFGLDNFFGAKKLANASVNLPASLQVIYDAIVPPVPKRSNKVLQKHYLEYRHNVEYHFLGSDRFLKIQSLQERMKKGIKIFKYNYGLEDQTSNFPAFQG